MDALNCLTSESGRFYLDESGLVQRFEPAGGNLFDAIRALINWKNEKSDKWVDAP